MVLLFTTARFFPYWAIPLAVILIDLGVYMRRKNEPIYRVLWLGASFLIAMAILWIAFRGDLHSDQWMKFFGPQ